MTTRGWWIAGALVLGGCSDVTGPVPSPAPPLSQVNDLRPQGKMVEGGGHGSGGGSGNGVICTRANTSYECMLQAAGLVAAGGAIAGCGFSGPALAACIAGTLAFPGRARAFLDTPDCRGECVDQGYWPPDNPFNRNSPDGLGGY